MPECPTFLPCNRLLPPALQAGGYAAAGAGLLVVGGLGTSDALVPGAALVIVGAALAAAWRYWRDQIQLTARLLRVSANGLAANPLSFAPAPSAPPAGGGSLFGGPGPAAV